MRSEFIARWMKRVSIGFKGFYLWLRAGYPFVLLVVGVLLVAWLRGNNWTELRPIFILGVVLIVTEMLDYAVERLCNSVVRGFNLNVKVVKDVSAGAVLVIGLAFCISGLYIIIRGG